jgi:hypothetical protein
MLDVAPSSHDAMMDHFLLPYLRGEEIKGATPSAFWSTYVLEVAVERRHAEQAVDFIRSRWAPMLSTGTVWEGFDWREESGGSCCHAWSAHPSFHLVNVLAGIFQRGAGWIEVVVRPSFVKTIDFVSARVPSPQGDIESEWRREGDKIAGRVNVPTGIRATLDLPGREATAFTGSIEYTV